MPRTPREASPPSGDDGLAEPAAFMDPAQHYGPVTGDRFPVPAVNLTQIDRSFLVTSVAYEGSEEPGTVVVNPATRFLYLVQEGGSAIRYGVGVGREGFGWSGSARIKSKQEWPDWYPPSEMIARQPELRAKMSALQSGLGMPGGPGNPLGARAMYLWQGNKDTLFRIHGTVEPWTIGKRVSSGCIRMINQDAMDLYDRVPLDTPVVVLGSGAGEVASARPRRRRAQEEPFDDPSWQDGDSLGGGSIYDPYRGSYGNGGYRPSVPDPYYGRGRVTDPYRLQGDTYARPYPPGGGYNPYGGAYRILPDH
jgi:lipoprotein-anchoring transpeptidase ErfK/SrfK